MSLSNLLLDSQTTAILWLDAGQRCLYLNPAAEELLQISGREAARGRRLNALLPFAEGWCRSLREAAAAEQPATWREYAIPLGPPETGRQITVDCTVTPLNPQDLPGVTLLLELTPLDRHLLISREQHLQEEQQTRRALLRGLAHEIRNPLGGLRGAAQLLERELPDEELQEYTRVIMREADRLRSLVDALLGSPKALQTRPHNVHELLAHVMRLITAENQAERRGNTAIKCDYDPSLPDISVDSDQLIQVLLNISRNAVTAMHAGSETQSTQLLLRTRALRQYTLNSTRHRLVLKIDIEDNGPGIPAHLRERLFFPLVSGKTSGHGLGLAIAQEIAMRHGGLIEYDSRPGRTVFSILLPYQALTGELT